MSQARGEHLDAERAELLLGRGVELLLLAPADRDLRAELAERARRREADAAAAAGDDGDVSVEEAVSEDVGHGESVSTA